jgi:hypothetical protein
MCVAGKNPDPSLVSHTLAHIIEPKPNGIEIVGDGEDFS